MTRRDLPNLITLFRIVLVAPLAWGLLNGVFGLALLLFALAGISDAVDGHLARRNGWQSALGALLDPLADKLLMLTVYLALGGLGFLPLALVVVVLVRDLAIVTGATVYRLCIGPVEMAPTLISKINTVLQIALALVAIASSGLGWLPAWSSEVLIAAVFASTILSGTQYVGVWSRRAWRESRRKNA